MRLAVSITICLLGSVVHAADQVSPALADAFRDASARAEVARAKGGAQAAIQIYEEALLADAYGRYHLRLGQLYRDEAQFAKAAAAFRACREDERVDLADREIICKTGFGEVTAPLTVRGLPRDGKVVIVEPAPFAGPFLSGNPVPKGTLVVTTEAPGVMARQSEIQIDGPTEWQAVMGLVKPRGPIVPSGFVGEEGDAPLDAPEPPPQSDAFVHDFAGEEEDGALRWPAYTAGGVGLALVAAGLTLGFVNQGDLDDIRDRQRSGGCAAFCSQDLVDAENNAVVADALWITGAVVAAGSIALWFIFDE